ncbi:MAG: hypothetical protein JWO40_749 [Candidatus Doudnabacteria bacterium]|nr:hypothetical protein [Candidatus Doudnabacteria bacterium]
MLYQLVKTAKADAEKRFSAAKISVTPLQYGILVLIKSKPITIKEMAKTFSMQPPSLVPLVDVLEDEKYLLRKPDKKDRRNLNLVITKKGTQLLSKFPMGDSESGLNKAFSKLSVAKQKQLLELLKELNNNFPV